MSRTSLKQQLMKEQLIQQEMREKCPSRMRQCLPIPQSPLALQPQQQQQQHHSQHTQQQQHSQHNSCPQTVSASAPTVTSLTFNQLTNHLQSHSHQLMQKVQQNQMRSLENPTNYHVMQTQKQQQIMKMSSNDHQCQTLTQSQTHTHTQSLNGNTQTMSANGPQSPFALSPDSPLSAPPSSVCSTSELDDVFDVLGSFDTQSEIVDSAIANTLPADINYYLEEPVQTGTNKARLGNVSTSCPQLTDQEIKAWQKDRIKKDNHNQIERRRRYNINDRIKELGTLLPKPDESKHYDLIKDMKQNKGTILKASVDYVRMLKRENNRMNEQEKRYKEMESDYRRLQVRVNQLEQELSAINTNNSNAFQPWTPLVEVESSEVSELLNGITNVMTDVNAMGMGMSELSVSEADLSLFAAHNSLKTIIKQEYKEYMTSTPTTRSPMSPIPSQSSSGLGSGSASSIPSHSPAQQYFHYNDSTMDVRHDPVLSAATINIKTEAYSPQSMDICN